MINHTRRSGRLISKYKMLKIVNTVNSVTEKEQCACCRSTCSKNVKVKKISTLNEESRFKTSFSLQNYKEAIQSDSLQNIKRLLDDNFYFGGSEDIKNIDSNHTSALMYAIKLLRKDIALQILDKRQDLVFHCDNKQKTIWHSLGENFREYDKDVLYEGNKICSVCLDPMNKGLVTKLTTCNHLLHTECFERWMFDFKKDTCPICRYSVSERTKFIEEEKCLLAYNILKKTKLLDYSIPSSAIELAEKNKYFKLAEILTYGYFEDY